MNEEKRFSVERGVEGCLASMICITVLMLPISLVLNEWFKLISNETERILGLFIWLFAIGVGGYFAARRRSTAGWTNSLVVGVLAEAFVAVRLLDGTSLLEMMDDPGPNWRRLAALGLTIPVAIVGGLCPGEGSQIKSSR